MIFAVMGKHRQNLVITC